MLRSEVSLRMLEDSREGRDSRCHTVQAEHEAPSCHPQDASEGKVPWKALSCGWKGEGQGTATLYARLIPSHHSYDRGQISFSSPPAATEGRRQEVGQTRRKTASRQQMGDQLGSHGGLLNKAAASLECLTLILPKGRGFQLLPASPLYGQQSQWEESLNATRIPVTAEG